MPVHWRARTLTMSRWQRVVFHPGRILFSAPRLSNSLWGPLGARESSQGRIDSPSACRRMMWLLEDLNEFQGFLEQTVCFCPCERIRQPCGHQLQRSPVFWLLHCWLVAAYKCCWPLKMMSHRASASPTVSPNCSHIMTPMFHLEVPAFSLTLNGFTCTNMLPMRTLWMRGVGVLQDFAPNSQVPRAEQQAAANLLSIKSWTCLLQHKGLQTQTVML